MYVYPNLGLQDFYFFRCFGAGLGNLLFPWARAQLAARRLGYAFIEPTWPQIKIGTLIRGESDPRLYTGLFRSDGESVRGLRRLHLLLMAQRISEEKIHSIDFISDKKALIVEYTGLSNYFEPLIGHSSFIKEKLIAITQERHLCGLNHDFSNSITVHVRLGDFTLNNLQTPIQWYVNTIHSLRQKLGSSWQVWVFSDGTDKQLGELLSLPNVQRLSFKSSVADLLAMSESKLLVGSKHSTFSRWAAFLGEMPSVWPKESSSLRCQESSREVSSETGVLSDHDFACLASWL